MPSQLPPVIGEIVKQSVETQYYIYRNPVRLAFVNNKAIFLVDKQEIRGHR